MAGGAARLLLARSVCLVCALAIGCEDAPRAARPSTEGSAGGARELPLAPADFFPLAPGDRVRIAVRPTGARHNEGVTGVDERGIAMVHGTAHTTGERYRATETDVSLVTPDGTPLVPILRAPLTRGARFDYTLTESDVAVPCEVEIRRTSATATVAGAALASCIELVRRCEYAAGHPFPSATTHTTEETFCPGVGRVRERGRFDPPPQLTAIPAEREERVVYYRIAGAPAATAPSSGCDAFILLPSDVIAACGAGIAPIEPLAGTDLPGGGCEHAFDRAGARLAIRFGAPFPVAEAGGEDEAVTRVVEDAPRIEVRAAPAACSGEGLARLEPLLRSLAE
jgi:hypothetical protein